MKEFLQNKGVIGHVAKYREKARTYYELSVNEGINALAVLKKMSPYVDKKASQVRAAIEYLENRITGEKFVEEMNEALRLRKRSSSIWSLKMPLHKTRGPSISWSYSEIRKK